MGICYNIIMKHKLLKIFLPILAVVLIIAGFFIFKPSNKELKNISSEAELYSFYTGSESTGLRDSPLLRLVTLPFSLLLHDSYYDPCPECDYIIEDWASKGISIDDIEYNSASEDSATGSSDFSTTNIQVENVDEADIIKNDGSYIYSLADTNVVITDVRDPANPTIVSRITSPDDSAPVDLILTDDVLTVISTEDYGGGFGFVWRNYNYYREQDTIVSVYDIKDREDPRLEKSYRLELPYYTSRRIDNQLYVIASGRLHAEDSKVILKYEEDYVEKTFPATSVRYLKDVKTNTLTIVSRVDLGDLDSDISLDPFLIDISNAYVSENAFYLLDEKYEYSYSEGSILDDLAHLFGLKGVFGYAEYKNGEYNYSDSGYYTEIYKFDIQKSGDISYSAKTKAEGSTINQYSLDEKDGHLRVALHEDDGSFVAIFDEKLNKIGESGRLAKNEIMYASRFIGDKAYLVTYRNTDPLFVIDLSDETKPKVLGELKIPGYSVYLHPYDENHLIGIGVDTEEEMRRDINGRIIWTTAYITGMKLALFDVSDVKNPREISKIKIGDSYTTSAILTNPKALLFSKEKQLLAIPVNNYADEYKIEVSDTDDLSDFVSVIRDYYDDYVSEGYLIYNINLENGITEKGSIIHEDSELIRGAYIDNNLITVSENTLKINELSELKPISELDLTK